MIDAKLREIVGADEETYANFPTRVRLAKEMAAAVNEFIPKAPAERVEFPLAMLNSHEELNQEGMVRLGSMLSKEQVADILHFFSDKMVYNSHVPHGDGVLRPLEESGGQSRCYDPKDILTCPHLLELALKPDLLRLTSAYLGCLPTIYSMNCFWTMAGTSQGVQNYHRDLDSHKFCTLLVYLVDVDEGTAPHVFIRRTHDQNIMEGINPRLAGCTFPPNPFPYPSLDELSPYIETITGSAGDGCLLDTFGIHKGSGNVQKRRLILWFRYAVDRAPPSLTQMPKPLSLDVKDRIEWDEQTKYITRVLLEHQ